MTRKRKRPKAGSSRPAKRTDEAANGSRQDKQTDEGPKKRRGIVPIAAGIVLIALLSIAVLFLWPKTNMSPTGHFLGSLPEGVQASDLNLLIVTLDSTRADRIHAYGFDDIETPHLDRIAREGVLFEQAVASAPLTLPAHATIFTSKSPPAHGVRDNGGFYLDQEETTLAELLTQDGFRTAAFIGAYALDSKWGIDQGFDTYFDDFDLSKEETLSLAAINRPGDEVTDRALEWLETVESSRFFGWVHYYDPHSPYEPPEPFKSRYPNRPYVGEIAFTDSQVGRILSWLDERNLMDKTVVVIVGDHGENLGQHGESTHGFFVYDGVIRVPFLIRAPYERTRGMRVKDVVRGVDVFPTVLDLLNIATPEKGEGESLVPLMTGDVQELELPAYSEAVYPLYHFGWSDLRSIRMGNYKYIDAPRPELYDISADPDEIDNILGEHPDIVQDLRARLAELEEQMDTPRETGPRAEIDPDTRDRLAALGYVGTFVEPLGSPTDRALLSDPKDKIELYNLMIRAREIFRRNLESTEGIEALERITSEDPEVIDAWFMLGNEYFKRREYERAIANFLRALELKPGYDLAVINMANAYRRLGEDDKAMEGYRRFMQLDPNNPQIRYETAQILIDRGELDEAEGQLREALKLEPNMAAGQNALGVVFIERGDVEGAEREIRSALDKKSDVRHANYNLALIAEHKKDFQAAIDYYEKEIELYPKSYKSHYNLAKLHGYLGDRRTQLEHYLKAVETNEYFAEGYLSLAKLYLDMERNLDEALSMAKKGLELSPHSAFAPMGHYVLADIYNRQGKPDLAAKEVQKGRALEARLKN